MARIRDATVHDLPKKRAAKTSDKKTPANQRPSVTLERCRSQVEVLPWPLVGQRSRITDSVVCP